MSTDFSPLFRNTSGHTQRFGAEETLTWDFTSATGDPMVLLVGGSTYFTFGRGGTLLIESNITWNADTGGDVGALYDHRPDSVSAASLLAVGAISAGSPGAKLQLNTLTLGHGNVNKYIDAQQGLPNTPALRYNAVNTRWEFSDDGIAYTAFSAGFGTTTWDALYASDQTLIIDSTVLTFNQTATTGVAFQVVRNLASGSTANPILLAEQQNAADDQPALAVAQVATAASALDIYEGLQATGTIRYGFGATGKLTITTKSSLADSAIHIVQNDVDDSFATFEGTSGAGASVNISTDNGATADMIQVTVDGGTAATRWIPAYSTTTLPGAISWDGIYLLDKKLDINAAVLQFEQTSTSGRGFEVFRNLTATSTSAPIVVLEQQHVADDQPPLALGQLASATDVLRLYDGSVASGTLRFQFQPKGRLNIVTEATLASAALRLEQNDIDQPFVGFKGTAAAGAGRNISTDNNPTADMLRVEVDDGGGAATRWVPAYNSSTLPAIVSWDDIYASYQTLDISGTVLTFDQSSTSGIGFTVSRNLTAASTDSPIMKVSQGNSLDDQAALLVSGGIADVAGGVPVLDTLATSAGMASMGDIMMGARSTVVRHSSDSFGTYSNAYRADVTGAVGSAITVGFWAGGAFDSGIYSESPIDVALPAGGGSIAVAVAVDDLTADGVAVAGVGSNTGSAFTVDTNWALGLNTESPAHVSNPAGAADAIEVGQIGTGSILKLWSGVIDSGSLRLSVSKVGALAHTPANPTATFTAHTTALSSGGANGATAVLSALEINTAGHASDTNDLPIRGITLDHTAGAGSEVATAILVEPGYNNGIFIDSAPSATGASILACGDGVGSLMLLVDGTIATIGSGATNRLIIANSGAASFYIDNAAEGMYVVQSDTGGSANILKLRDGDNSINRLVVTQAGVSTLRANSANTALSVRQDGAGLIADFTDSGTSRLSISEAGAAILTTKTDLGSGALQIDQNDADKPFIDYEGDIAAAGSYDSTKNIQEWKGGSGAVDGPLGQSAAEAYWRFQGMVKTEVNGSEYWMPYYVYSAS